MLVEPDWITVSTGEDFAGSGSFIDESTAVTLLVEAPVPWLPPPDEDLVSALATLDAW